MRLDGARVLVTGGAHRLGKAIALAFAQAGAQVAIHYNSSGEAATATLEELRSQGSRAAAYQADLSDIAAAEGMLDTAAGELGGLDVLVNSAGIWGPTPMGSVSAERWDELMATNLRSAFFLCQRAAPLLRAAYGSIVNIADVGALRPWKNYTPYLISKGGVVTMTEALAKDLAPDVRVNAIAPGPVMMQPTATEQERERAANSVLLKRVGSAEDVAQAAVYLAGAPYVTGVILPVDGGQRLI